MLILMLARLDDWESDSHTGYISSISEHGVFLTYATYYASYINNTVTGTSDVLYSSVKPRNILVAVYDDLYLTFSEENGNIKVYYNYTFYNDDNVTETAWNETPCTFLATAASQLYFYKDVVAFLSSKTVYIRAIERGKVNESENVAKDTKYLLTVEQNYWTFLEVFANDTYMPMIFYSKNKIFKLYRYVNGTLDQEIKIPELDGLSSVSIVTSNSSEHDNLVTFMIGNDTLMVFKIWYDNITEPAKFVATYVHTINITAEVLPHIDLADIAVYYDYYLYKFFKVVLFETSYIAVYPLIPDAGIYYVSLDADKDYYTILLMRLADKEIFKLTVDNAPIGLYSNGYYKLYMFGSQDGSYSGYFSIDLNYLFKPYVGYQVSCWTNAAKLEHFYDATKLTLYVKLLSYEACDPKPPRAGAICDLTSCQPMELKTELNGDVVQYNFIGTSDHEMGISVDFITYGAIGVDSSGKLAAQITVGVPLEPILPSCWVEGNLDGTLAYNLLILKIDSAAPYCTHETPIITAEAKTFLKQKVYLRLLSQPSPAASAVYMYFFDPGDETFAGDVDFLITVQSISPSGHPAGTPRVIPYYFGTDMNSCWNIYKYIGMSYNGDHFELLLANRIWSERTDPVCDSRIDEMPDLEVKFSYKTKKKHSLTLEESDFVKLDNGKWAYFVEFDVYGDWVSSTVHLFTDGSVEPYVGDKFSLDGDYPIEFVEPDSCFEFTELLRVEYDNDNHAYVTVDHYYWCALLPLDSDNSVVIYALNQDPDYDGDYPYCNMTYVPEKGYYENRDCELEIGVTVNFTVFKTDTYINEHDEWEEGELIDFTLLVQVADSRYDYTYIILVAVFGGLLIILAAGWIVYWYIRKYKPPMSDENQPFETTSTVGTLPSIDGIPDQAGLPRPERYKRSIFGTKKKRDKAFDEELFAAIPAPPTKW